MVYIKIYLINMIIGKIYLLNQIKNLIIKGRNEDQKKLIYL